MIPIKRQLFTLFNRTREFLMYELLIVPKRRVNSLAKGFAMLSGWGEQFHFQKKLLAKELLDNIDDIQLAHWPMLN